MVEQFDNDGLTLLSRTINHYEQSTLLGNIYVQHINVKPMIYRVNLIKSTKALYRIPTGEPEKPINTIHLTPISATRNNHINMI